uniref:(California timema) hypothetical protein n=1 Tax=Timema californicum TaxID=61474 RepID=A0A7R9PD13_TIMCA|nr:unnamed protein product [Timema californicum]
MLEDIYRDDLIGDPNDLEEIIEGDLDDPQNEDNDNEDEIAGEGNQPDPIGTPIEPKKRKVLRPQPKLNAERKVTRIWSGLDFHLFSKGLGQWSKKISHQLLTRQIFQELRMTHLYSQLHCKPLPQPHTVIPVVSSPRISQ